MILYSYDYFYKCVLDLQVSTKVHYTCANALYNISTISLATASRTHCESHFFKNKIAFKETENQPLTRNAFHTFLQSRSTKQSY